jgi:hypothetical protein
MKVFCFSIRQLLGITAYFAAVFASLMFASGLWVQLWGSFTIFVLLVSLVGMFVARGEQRAFWIGFFTFGCAYLALLHGFLNQFQGVLITRWFHVLSSVFPYRYGPPGDAGIQIGQGWWSFTETIAHFAFTNLFAFVGGSVGRLIFSRSQNTE